MNHDDQLSLFDTFSSVTERWTNREIEGQTGVPTMAKAVLA